MWNAEEVKGLPTFHNDKLLSSKALEEGRIEFDESTHGLPEESRNSRVPPSMQAKQLALMLFGLKFLSCDFARRDLENAAQLYPLKNDAIDIIDLHLANWELYEKGMAAPVKGYGEYFEAIMHICARGRLGNTWLRVVHGSVVIYLAPNSDGSRTESSFEPYLTCRFIDPVEGALDGYFVVSQVNVPTPGGGRLTLAPAQSKREVMKGQDKEARLILEDDWVSIEENKRRARGYKRRRGPSQASLEAWADWLFRRHVLREAIDDIAADENTTAAFVADRVRYLRKELDLQPKFAVRCRHGRPPHYY